MVRRRAAKTVRFTVEFDAPSQEQKLSVECPYCKAEVGMRCQTNRGRWNPTTQQMDRRMVRISTIHHDRLAVSLGLKIVERASIYKL